MEPHKQVGVAVIGDVLDVDTWSGTPYYFYKEGERQGVFQQPWRLKVSDFTWSRIQWNLERVLSGKGKGGYQYSREFLDRAEDSIPAEYFSSTVISFNQLFPRASSVIKKHGKMYYYIDCTLTDLFASREYGIDLPLAVKEKAIALERENYQQAERIVTMADWVHDSLISDYGIPKTKLAVIVPGANVTMPEVFRLPEFSPGAGITRDLVMGFIGKDWRRKGLPFLLDVRDCLEKQGLRARVKVIGTAPSELRNRKGVDFCGFISKKDNVKEFVTQVSTCDIGALFSASEALGISVLEFLRMGVPVMGYYHQGLRSTLVEDVSLRFAPGDSPARVARVVADVVTGSGGLSTLKAQASVHSGATTWETAVHRWKDMLA